MVEWNYLFTVLRVYGFGDNFLKLIYLLYKCPRAAVQTNNCVSEYFELKRGTRQGSPLSPLLFCLVIEPLAMAIRKEENFPGVQVGGTAHKLMLYADDIILFVSEPDRSIPTLFKIINSFSNLSGYKVNWSKSKALPLTAHCPANLFKPGEFQWPKKGIKYLGILFPRCLKDLIRVNYDPLMQKISCDVHRWGVLNLSLIGKVNVIKTNCVPKINYLFQSLPVEVPRSYFDHFDKLIKHFIWKQEMPKNEFK